MNLKIKILSNKVLNGESKIDICKISKLLLLFGINVDEVLMLNEKTKLDKISEATIFIMPDESIDEFVSNHKIFYETDSKIIESMAVLSGNDFPIIVLPIESDVCFLLEKVLNQVKARFNLKNVKIYRLFGKTKEEIEDILNQNSLKVSVFGKGLLCDLFLQSEAGFISEEEVKINEIFKDYIYSQSKLSMKDVIQRLLILRNEKLVILDAFTGGKIAEYVLDACCKDVTSQTFNTYYGPDFIKIDDKCYKDEEDLVSKISRQEIENSSNKIAVAVVGKNIDEAYKITVAIAKQKKVDIYNLSIEGSLIDAIEIGRDWTLFNLIKKLEEKDFENYGN